MPSHDVASFFLPPRTEGDILARPVFAVEIIPLPQGLNQNKRSLIARKHKSARSFRVVGVLLFYPLGSAERMDRSLQRFDVHWLRNMSIHTA